MKKLIYLLLSFSLLTFSSCQVIGDIFKTGVGVGIFIVVAIIAIVIFLFSRGSKK